MALLGGTETTDLGREGEPFRLVCCFTFYVTAMVISGWSVYVTTLFFMGKFQQAVSQYFVNIVALKLTTTLLE